MKLFVLVGYSKTFRKHSKLKTPVEVQGNALLQVDEETVERFGIPTFDAARIQAIEVKEYAYQRLPDGPSIQVSAHQRIYRGSRSGRNIARLPAAIAPRTHSIRFPGFFSIGQIAGALEGMLTRNRPLKWSLDRGGEYWLDAASFSDGFGKAWLAPELVAAKGEAEWPWGEVIVVASIAPRKRPLK